MTNLIVREVTVSNEGILLEMGLTSDELLYSTIVLKSGMHEKREKWLSLSSRHRCKYQAQRTVVKKEEESRLRICQLSSQEIH